MWGLFFCAPFIAIPIPQLDANQTGRHQTNATATVVELCIPYIAAHQKLSRRIKTLVEFSGGKL
jgi:hypothetical protein